MSPVRPAAFTAVAAHISWLVWPPTKIGVLNASWRLVRYRFHEVEAASESFSARE
jgi:hypothetical protein